DAGFAACTGAPLPSRVTAAAEISSVTAPVGGPESPVREFCVGATSSARANAGARIVACGVGAGCLGVLGLAPWLTPAAAGHGTHGQLGLPPCGWVLAMGRPCPSCGMTTAFAHAADG